MSQLADSEPTRAGQSFRRGPILLALGCAVSGAWPARALAAEAALPPKRVADAPGRRGASLDLRVSVGGAFSEYDVRDTTLAELEFVTLDAALHLGGFLTDHLLIGYELAGGYHLGVGEADVLEPTLFNYERPLPTRDWYSVFIPFGFFLELYPFRDRGVYAGASAGFGFIEMPTYVEEDDGLLVHYALEVGYELSVTGKLGPGGFVRYDRWLSSGIVDPFSSIDSHSLSVGARWSLF